MAGFVYRQKLFKRDKWRSLTVAAGYDKVSVPIFEAAGRGCKIPLLKTLMSSHCSNDCKFCAFRAGRRVHRDRWTPDELANATMYAWKRRQIQGLFLSSSVERDPDQMVENELEAVRLLRSRGFDAYVHLKIMPGVNFDLIKQAVQVADRVGINIEFPKAEHFDDMKIFLDFRQDVLKRMRLLAHEIRKAQKEGRCKAGLDSQMVVGAAGETDREIIEASDWMYNKLGARRVYYSTFNPVRETPLEHLPPESKWREYRLYQCSFLLQQFGFKRSDFTKFVLDGDGMLDLRHDPKLLYAAKNELSVNVNSAGFEELVKVPGIGVETANRILESRGLGARFVNGCELRNVGVILKRAAPFIELGSRQTRLHSFVSPRNVEMGTA